MKKYIYIFPVYKKDGELFLEKIHILKKDLQQEILKIESNKRFHSWGRHPITNKISLHMTETEEEIKARLLKCLENEKPMVFDNY
jgi:predicted ATP-dependent protease